MGRDVSSALGPVGVDNVFPESWNDAFQITQCDQITIGTWNVNALQPHMSQVIALNLDIVALQELRISNDTAAGLRHEARQNGYQFFHGALPQLKRTRKMVQLDKLVPGVGFLVRDSLTVRHNYLAEIQEWAANGRHCSIQIFLNGRWVQFHSIYAPAHEPSRCNDDILQALIATSHEDIVLLGDFNYDTREGSFVRQFADHGWCPLTMFLDYDEVTFSSSRGTSCIDSAIVSPSLVPHTTSLQVSTVFPIGHKVLSFWLRHKQTKNPTWEICNTANTDNSEVAEAEQIWSRCYHTLLQTCQNQPVQQLWEQWCSTFVKAHGNSNANLGVQPKYRVQDYSKMNHVHQQLCLATQQMDATRQQNLLDKIARYKRNQMRKWKNRITGRNLSPSQWMKQLFRWVRGPTLPVPSCIQSTNYGKDGFTVSLADSLLEIHDFFYKV